MLKHGYRYLVQTEKMKYNSLPLASLPIYSFTEWCRIGSCFLEWEPLSLKLVQLRQLINHCRIL